MLSYTELKTCIFCYQFHFYAWTQNHLHTFNLRCSIAQQAKEAVRALGAMCGHSLQWETFLQWKKLSSLFEQRPFSILPIPLGLRLLVWKSGCFDSIFDIPPSPSDLWILHLILLMPHVYSWKGEGKIIINRTCLVKIQGLKRNDLSIFRLWQSEIHSFMEIIRYTENKSPVFCFFLLPFKL